MRIHPSILLSILLAPLLATVALTSAGCWSPEARTVATEERSLTVGALDRLRVDVGAGDLEIVGDPTLETIEVTAYLRTNRGIGAPDQEAIDAFTVALEELDGEATLIVLLEGVPDGYYADLVVSVPSAIAIVGEDGSGNAHVASVASLDLIDGSGDLTVEDVPGAVTIDDDSGTIVVVGTGSVSIVDGSGTIHVESVSGSVVIEDEDGNLSVTGVSGDVDITDGSGEITVHDVAGIVRIRDGSGDIVVESSGELQLLSDSSGSVTER